MNPDVLWWSPDFSSNATMGLTFVVQSEMSISNNYRMVQTFMFHSECIVITLRIPLLFIQLNMRSKFEFVQYFYEKEKNKTNDIPISLKPRLYFLHLRVLKGPIDVNFIMRGCTGRLCGRLHTSKFLWPCAYYVTTDEILYVCPCLECFFHADSRK